jgi:tetratricopeptide (TPR) repeat protein
MLDTLLTPLEKDPRWREIWKKEWYSSREQADAAIRGDLALDDPAAALHEADAILAQYRDDATLLALRARARLAAGYPREAEKDLAQALAINDADTTVLMTSAMISREKEDFGTEAQNYEKLYIHRPGDFALLLKAADAWRQAGNPQKALTDVEQYRKYFPDEVHAMLLAGTLYAGKKDYRSALRLLSRVVEKDPGDPYNFVARGDVYMKAHTFRYAIYDYGMALDLDPSNGDVYYRRGEAYLKTGDRKSACYDFNRALHYGRKEAIIYLQKYCGK